MSGPSRRDLLFLFVALVSIFAYMSPRWNDWNQNSRLSLVRSIVEQGTVRIDTYADINGDFAYYNGHYYSDKPPGPALAGVVPYAVLKVLLSNPLADWALDKVSHSRAVTDTYNDAANRTAMSDTPRDSLISALGRVVISLWLVSIPVALMACLFWLWVCRITGTYWRSLGLTLALVLGTPLFPYSSLFYNHALSAALLFISFYCLYRIKGQKARQGTLVLVGFLMGFALISEYPTALIVGILGLYALATVSRKEWLHRVVWLTLGALPPLALMIGYDLIAFGTPLPVGYEYSLLWTDRHSQGFMSLTYPHVDALWGLSFSPYRGLFLLSPFLLLALPGFWFGLRRIGLRLEACVGLSSFVAFFLFNSSSVMWPGGNAFGPRYIVAGLPFLTMGVVFLLKEASQRSWRWYLLWFWLPIALSLALIVPASLVGRAWPAETYMNPLVDYLWPQLTAGNFALNPGTALGLKGIASYAPLALFLAVLYVLLYYWPHQNKTTEKYASAVSEFSLEK